MQSPEHLGLDHLQPLRRALSNVLSAPVAEFTFAQIIDGQPTRRVYANDHFFRDGLPVMDHEDLCPGSVERTRAFRSDFDILDLKFEPNIIQAYQDTLPGTIAWKLRLLELVVTACHDIAVYLYQMDNGVHKHAEHQAWRAKKLDTLSEDDLMERRKLPPPTLFWTSAYRDWSSYPNGLADMAGYWAEVQLFGGVVLFDRGESEKECNGVYIHNRRYTTIAPPTEAQFKNIIAFLLSESPDYDHCPLPIEITPDNKWRWDPYDARTTYHIFKSRHDIPNSPRPRRKDVITANNWPEIIDHSKISGEDFEERPSDEAEKVRARERIAMTISPNSRLWETFKKDIMRLQPDEKRQGRPPYFFDS
ncbi:hypothetical protein J7T55_015233 [Diaporthe amygdali]|uniref:uncharacterized protein n=1 Tax=Phomopsis amygdali TaxID=1214568 RepID=UPI0022FEA526|nr:uncharacterized protein J7T55_015233 [Diaporthe amygdali]KAJ0120504.1 hypothetical protein J7T55_015233 [Diaporthe amygdali]